MTAGDDGGADGTSTTWRGHNLGAGTARRGRDLGAGEVRRGSGAGGLKERRNREQEKERWVGPAGSRVGQGRKKWAGREKEMSFGPRIEGIQI